MDDNYDCLGELFRRSMDEFRRKNAPRVPEPKIYRVDFRGAVHHPDASLGPMHRAVIGERGLLNIGYIKSDPFVVQLFFEGGQTVQVPGDMCIIYQSPDGKGA